MSDFAVAIFFLCLVLLVVLITIADAMLYINLRKRVRRLEHGYQYYLDDKLEYVDELPKASVQVVKVYRNKSKK